MSFDEKRLKVTLYLGEKDKSFDDKGNNVVVLEGFRVSATVQSGNGAGVTPHAKVMIWGLSLDVMNKIVKIQWNTEQARLNNIKIEADNGDGNYSLVFQGNITFAYPNFGSASENILIIDSNTAIAQQITPVNPTSYNGEVDVAEAIKIICEQMNMQFENNGVNAKVSNPYLPQTALEKVRKLCEMANVNMYLDKNTIAITPKGQPRKNKIAVISPRSGLLGYPIPHLQGITIKCLYDPIITFGGTIEVRDSLIEMANGQWRVFGITINLESMVPNGRWEMEIQAASPTGGVRVAK